MDMMHVLIRVDEFLQSSNNGGTETRNKISRTIVHPNDRTKKIKLEIPGTEENGTPTLVNNYSILTENDEVENQGLYTVEETSRIYPNTKDGGWLSASLYENNVLGITKVFRTYYTSEWMIWDEAAHRRIESEFKPWTHSSEKYREELVTQKEYPPGKITVHFPRIDSSKLVLFFLSPEIANTGSATPEMISVICTRATIILN
jgi:hypothetical protein